jgi:hypothetical protein
MVDENELIVFVPKDAPAVLAGESLSFSHFREPFMLHKVFAFLFAVLQCASSASVPDYMLSNLKNPANNSDYLILCREMFLNVAAAHAEYRTQNRADSIENPRIVLLDTIFQTFTDTSALDYKIRDFFSFADTAWAMAPRFVLFVGEPVLPDSAETNYSCPTHYVFRDDTIPVPTDEWLVTRDTTMSTYWSKYAAGLAVGRIPARTVAEYQRVLDKTIAFESTFGISRNSALFISDSDDYANIDQCIQMPNTFYEETCSLRTAIPRYLKSQHIHGAMFSRSPDSSKRFLEDSIAATINQGTAFVSYYGMGYDNIWSDDKILMPDSILPKLMNDVPSVLLSFTMRTSPFHTRDKCIATKLLVQTPNGICAALGDSYKQYMRPLFRMQQDMWQMLPAETNLGVWIRKMKLMNPTESGVLWLNLLGDPGLVIGRSSISFGGSDEFEIVPDQQITIRGSVSAFSSGVVEVALLGLGQPFEDTTDCGTIIAHIGNPPLLHFTSVPLSGGQFTYAVPSDLGTPSKAIFCATDSIRQATAAVTFLNNGIGIKSAHSPVPFSLRLTIFRSSTYIHFENLPANTQARITLMQLDGRTMQSHTLQGKRSFDISTSGIRSGVILCVVDCAWGKSVKKFIIP